MDMKTEYFQERFQKFKGHMAGFIVAFSATIMFFHGKPPLNY